jgi:hypothetical protein
LTIYGLLTIYGCLGGRTQLQRVGKTAMGNNEDGVEGYVHVVATLSGDIIVV